MARATLARVELAHLEKLATALQEGKLISQLTLYDEESALSHELNLLTDKKFIYVINVSDTQLVQNW